MYEREPLLYNIHVPIPISQYSSWVAAYYYSQFEHLFARLKHAGHSVYFGISIINEELQWVSNKVHNFEIEQSPLKEEKLKVVSLTSLLYFPLSASDDENTMRIHSEIVERQHYLLLAHLGLVVTLTSLARGESLQSNVRN